MRILCDHNVHEKYINAFRQANWITVRSLREILEIDTPDSSVASYVDKHDLVVFTSDVRFLSPAEEDASRELEQSDFGIVYYQQTDDPSVSDVLSALCVINEAYADHSGIETYVPGDWISAE